MIYTVTLTPALDKTVVIPDFTVDHVNRIRTVRLDPGGKGINVSKVLKALGMESVATGIATSMAQEKSTMLRCGRGTGSCWPEKPLPARRTPCSANGFWR